MTKRTKTELATQLTELLPDNTNAEISPEDIRSVFTDHADSLVLWDSTAPTVAGAYASATVTFTDKPLNDQTIAIVDSLQACIEAGTGHNGSITVSQSESGLVLTLTQASTGTSGNTTITEGLDDVTKTDFTGGVNAAPSCVKGEVVFTKGTSDYFYVCVDTNLWRRSELSSF